MENKFIILPDKSRQTTKTKQDLKQINTQKEKKVRVIAQTDKWQQVLQSEYYTSQMQNDILTSHNTELPIYKMMIQQIQQKINGYKAQDLDKSLFSAPDFVDLDYTIDLIKKSGLKCYYCKHNVKILYEHVREPKQWSLERIDNDYGHTKNNVEIACLSCNLRRKTMYHERFIFTKQLNIVKNG
jgi:hypothetical protein